MWKKWNLIFFVALLISCSMIVCFFEYVLYRINENLDINQSVAKQLETDSLYGRWLIGQDAVYKLQMAKAQKADVLAVGTSRVMQFRREFFRDEVTFYNAGGVMPVMEQGIFFTKDILQEYKPKVVILGAEIVLLNPNSYMTFDRDTRLAGNNIFRIRNSLYASLMDKWYSDRERLVKLLRNNHNGVLDITTNRPSIGIPATFGRGFRLDGSYQYGDILSGKKKIDEEFKAVFDRIESGKGRFEYANNIDDTKLEQFREMIKLYKKEGVAVVVFASPFAHKVYIALQDSPKHRGFIDDFHVKIRDMCKEENVEFYDFSDVNWYGSSDKEVIDGLHASEKSYGRLMLAMSEKSILSTYVDRERLKTRINETKSSYSLFR